MSEDKIRVVLLEPNRMAKVAEIEGSLEAMQRVVQGDIQAIYPFEEEVCIVCNEEGKIDGLPLNRALYDYSATNALLVMAQRPLATQLRDFNGWKKEGVSIKRGENHIKILEAGNNYERDDGSIGTGWNVKHVFDVSQTTSKTRMPPAPVPDDRQLLKALIHKAPVPIQGVDELPNNMGALYDHDQKTIFVRRGMDAYDIFRSLSKELAHAELAISRPDYTRQDAGFAAYSVSYMVCKRYGVDVNAYDFSHLPESFREADPQSIRSQLSEIGETAKEITGRMNRALEQSKTPRGKEQER